MSQAGQTGDQYSRSTWALWTPTRRAPSASAAVVTSQPHDNPGFAATRRHSRQGDKPRRRHPGGGSHTSSQGHPNLPSGRRRLAHHFFGSTPSRRRWQTVRTVTVSSSNPDGTPLPTQHDFSVAIAEVEVLEAAGPPLIPTDFAQCQQDPFLPLDGGERRRSDAKPTSRVAPAAGRTGTTRSRRRRLAQEAGCLRLATDAELEGALYPKKELDGIVAGRQPHRQGTPRISGPGCAPVAG